MSAYFHLFLRLLHWSVAISQSTCHCNSMTYLSRPSLLHVSENDLCGTEKEVPTYAGAFASVLLRRQVSTQSYVTKIREKYLLLRSGRANLLLLKSVSAAYIHIPFR